MSRVKKISEPRNPVGTVAELFAGVGGFRLGLTEAGWQTIYSNQWEPSTKIQHASDVYVANFGSSGHSNEDISKVDNIPKVDLLVGGFPCQDYSVAKSLNSSKGLAGKKGVLWWEILRLVNKKKPEFLFLENVDLQFSDDAIRQMAKIAFSKGTGARALRSVVETVMNDLMFEACDLGKKIIVDKSYVDKTTTNRDTAA